MSDIYESIYAYLYENNYSGGKLYGQQIYTLTEGLGGEQTSRLMTVMDELGVAGLARIDGTDGVGAEKPEPDYGAVSYMYIPDSRAGFKAVVARTSMRASLKDKSVRGHKELTHAALFDSLPKDVYAVDYALSAALESPADIELDTSVSLPEDADYVCEVKPQRLPHIDGTRFSSYPLSPSDINNLGEGGALKVLGEILNAVFAAKKQRKTAYIIYNPEDGKLACEYIRAALKLMPADIANGFSFVTCYGGTGCRRDICGVPTCDDGYIHKLSESGFVVQIQGGGAIGCGAGGSAFADFFRTASYADAERWLRCAPDYFAAVRNMSDLDGVMALFLNKQACAGADAAKLRSIIEFVCNRLDAVLKIRGELKDQVRSISASVERLCGEFADVAENDAFAVLSPLAALYGLIKPHDGELADDVMRLVSEMCFGYGGQSADTEVRHFKLLAVRFGEVKRMLGAGYAEFVARMTDDPDFMRGFLTRFMLNADYAEKGAAVVFDLLTVAIADIERRFGAAAELRDLLTELYAGNVTPKQTAALFELIFSTAAARATQFEYALKHVAAVSADDGERHTAVLAELTEYIAAHCLKDGVIYFCDAYSSLDAADDAKPVLSGLLGAYIRGGRKTLDGLCDAYDEVKALTEEVHAGAGLRAFLLGDLVTRMISPDGDAACRAARVETLTDADAERYTAFAAALKGAADGFCKKLTAIIDKYRVYVEQREREKTLTEFRYTFVLREFSLLGARTAYRILKKYVGESKLAEEFAAAGITGAKPHKDARFAAVAEDIARRLLCSDAPEIPKSQFCAEVRKIRKGRHVDFRIRLTDAMRRIAESTLLAAVLLAITGVASVLLYRYYAGGYFRSVYITFPVAAAVFAEVMYWHGAAGKNARLHNTLANAAWQSATLVAVSMTIYIAVQALLAVVY